MAAERQPCCLAVDKHAMATTTSDFDNLPKEIVAEIMSRLPPKSLMECKFLNKSWYFVIKCLIKDPKFVAKHLHHAKSSPATLLVYYRFLRHEYELMTSLVTTSSCNKGDNEDPHLVSEHLNLPVYFTQQGHENVHHCDGVVCLTGGSTSITLCNLALHEFCMFNPGTELDISECRIHGTGFGKDLSSGNYKIVRLLDPVKAEVFIPGSTNYWREIGFPIEDELYGNLVEHVYLKGKCFWLVSGVPWTILCFALCTEVFHTILLPNGEDFRSNITIHNDSLCFFWYPAVSESRDCIHMWKMDFNDCGDGIEGFTYSWRKCLKTRPFERSYIPLTFWRSNELLVLDEELDASSRTQKVPEGDDGRPMDGENDLILSYNIRTRKLRKVKLPVYGTLGAICYKGPYVMSLVSIKEKKPAW